MTTGTLGLSEPSACSSCRLQLLGSLAAGTPHVTSVHSLADSLARQFLISMYLVFKFAYYNFKFAYYRNLWVIFRFVKSYFWLVFNIISVDTKLTTYKINMSACADWMKFILKLDWFRSIQIHRRSPKYQNKQVFLRKRFDCILENSGEYGCSENFTMK